MKKILQLIWLITLMMTVLIPVGYGKGKSAEIAAKELRIGTQPAPQYAPIFVAKKQGWLEAELKQEKINVKWISFLAGPPINEAFAAGQVDIGLMGDTPAIIARASGQDLRIIGLASSGPKALAVVVRKNATIKSAKDLKGKRVAVTKGSYAHHLLALVLQNSGLTLEDVQLINLPVADIGTVLNTGDIEAGAIWEPYITKWEENGTIRVLADGTNIKKGLLVILASNKFAVQNRPLVNAFLKAYQRGCDFIKANPERAAKLISDEVKLTPKQLVKVFTKFDYWPGISDADIEEFQTSEEFMRAHKIIKAQVNFDDFIDSRYLKAIGIK